MAFIPARHGTKNTGRRPENNNGVTRVLDERREREKEREGKRNVLRPAGTRMQLNQSSAKMGFLVPASLPTS